MRNQFWMNTLFAALLLGMFIAAVTLDYANAEKAETEWRTRAELAERSLSWMLEAHGVRTQKGGILMYEWKGTRPASAVSDWSFGRTVDDKTRGVRVRMTRRP